MLGRQPRPCPRRPGTSRSIREICVIRGQLPVAASAGPRTTRFHVSLASLKLSTKATSSPVMFSYPSICAMGLSLKALTTLGSTITLPSTIRSGTN